MSILPAASPPRRCVLYPTHMMSAVSRLPDCQVDAGRPVLLQVDGDDQQDGREAAVDQDCDMVE